MIDLVLSAPGKNALGSELMQSIRDRLREAAGAPVLLIGDGGAFSAGLNLKEVASLDPAGMKRFLALLEDLVLDLFTYPGPLVACVNGHAIAGGAVVTLCADHRVATSDPKARIGLNEVAIGVRYPPRVMALVRDRVPKWSLSRVLLGAGLHSPQTAQTLGMVDELADDPERLARERLEALAAHPRDAYAAAKREIRDGVLGPTPAHQARFEREDLPAWTSPALGERIRALLAR